MMFTFPTIISVEVVFIKIIKDIFKFLSEKLSWRFRLTLLFLTTIMETNAKSLRTSSNYVIDL